MRTTSSAALLIALLTSFAPAQAAPPTFVPKRTPLMHTVIAGADKMLEDFPKLRIYPLLEEYGLVDRVRELTKASGTSKRSLMLRQEAVRCGLELDVYELSSLLNATGSGLFQKFDGEDYRQVEMMVLQWQEGGERRYAHVTVSSCSPRALGRWSKHYEEEIAWWRSCGWFDVRDDLKVDGMPAAAFVIPQAKREADQFGGIAQARWFLPLPGSFVDASGPDSLLDDFGRIEMAPPARPTGFSYEFSFAAILNSEARADELAKLLMNGMNRLRFSVALEKDLVREEVEVLLDQPDEQAQQPTFANVLFDGEGPLADQALPKGALAQLRVRAKVDAAFELLDTTGLLRRLPPVLLENGRKVLDGALTLGLCAPAPGGVIPRIYLTCGLADADAFTALLEAVKKMDLPMKEVVYGDTPCTIIQLEGIPQGIQPTFCVIGDRLHVAESPLSMKAFLKAQRSGDEVMLLEEPTRPATVPGDSLATYELRMDPAAAYRAFYEIWFPLLQLSMGSTGVKMSRDDLPDPDDFDEYATPVEAAFFRDGRRIGMHSIGTLGGLVGNIYGVMLPVMMTRSSFAHAQLAGPLAAFKLTKIGKAIDKFERREGRAPKDLAELIVAERLAPNALLLPGDEHAETVQLPNGKTVVTSFRYYPQPVEVDVFGTDYEARMIQIEPGYGRRLLETDGRIQEMWGDASDEPIDSFQQKGGKGGQGGK